MAKTAGAPPTLGLPTREGRNVELVTQTHGETSSAGVNLMTLGKSKVALADSS